MQTATGASARRAGRAYVRVEAVDDSGFQLLKGAYRLRVQAAGADGRISRALEAPFRLKLTLPRGQFDAYTVPLLPAFRRQAGAAADAQGQLVAVVGPKGAAATAGIRRGDIITAVNGKSVATRAAGPSRCARCRPRSPPRSNVVRRGQPLAVQVTPKPDWEKAPDYAAS